MNAKLLALVSKAISKIKKEEYILDTKIGLFQTILIINNRVIMIMRGSIRRIFFKESKGFLFCGKNVKLVAKNKIVQTGLMTIEDNCYINAISNNGILVGKNFSLGRNSIIECTGVISELGDGLIIGDNVGIAANSFIGVRGMITIGSDTIIGPGVSFHSENHIFNKNNELIRNQSTSRLGIAIGENCWIGSKSIILDGVKLGDGCVVAAGAVVTKSFPNNVLIGGIPARVLKELN